MSGATSATVDIKYDFTPYDGTPGKAWDDFEDRLLKAASRTDDRGWSLADHITRVDEGGASDSLSAVQLYKLERGNVVDPDVPGP